MRTAALHPSVDMHYEFTGMEPSSVRGAKIPRDGRTGALLSPWSGISQGCRNDGGGRSGVARAIEMIIPTGLSRRACCACWRRRRRRSRSRAARRWRGPPSLRRGGALVQSDASGRDHAQAGERRARQALVRAGARARMSVARARLAARTRGASRSPRSVLDDWRIDSVELAPKIGDLLGPAARHARRAALRARLQPDVRDGGARRRAPVGRHSVPRRYDGVFLAVEGQAASTTATTARARCGRATRWSGCSPV